MNKNLTYWAIIALLIFTVDQSIKILFIQGYEWTSKCFSLELHYNTGVAFSMFASLGLWLKWIQLVLIAGLIFIIIRDNYYKTFLLPSAFIVGAALGNLIDRFIHVGVVDYFAWHCGFRFAVFNFADVMINIAVAIFLWQVFINKKSL